MKIILALLAWVAVLPAQSWEALGGLKPSDKIKVIDTAGQEYRGSFQASSERGISLATGKQAVEIERARVRRVQVRASSRRVRNLLIGAAIGVAVGVAIDQTWGAYLRNETGNPNRALNYVAPIAIIAGIGAALPAYRTVYRAP